MYEVQRNGKTVLEADACGIGFIATRNGVPDRKLVELGLHLGKSFDHRGAPGHGAGIQLDIPWPLLLDRFPEHGKAVAQRNVALGNFFLPFDPPLRRRCVETLEELASLAGADVLQWADVPVDASALDASSGALRTLPILRQALFRRPEGLGEDAWFACRYLLRLALDNVLSGVAGDEFSVVSLSNRTVVYKGLGKLSKIDELYPDLKDPHTASRFVLFHSRYCTNTTTAWRRAQPFWSIAHNGEIATIKGNVAWMNAIGRDLVRALVHRHPELERIASHAGSIVCSGGSDTANLDDMVIALMAGGMSLAQAVLALLPEASSAIPEHGPLHEFFRSTSIYLGACDGPAALVGCDGDTAVAHLDRNGLRPLWIARSKGYVLAASELTGTLDIGPVEFQRVMGPGETMAVSLSSGDVMLNDQVHAEVARKPVPSPTPRVLQAYNSSKVEAPADLEAMQRIFGMTAEDIDVVLQPLIELGKPALGAMGDDTAPAAMLDELPRRLEDHFKLRFAQETSPPIDPIRDAWVFDTSAVIGDRGGLWSRVDGRLYQFNSRLISRGECAWLKLQEGVETFELHFAAEGGPDRIESAIDSVLDATVAKVPGASVILLTDTGVDGTRAPLPPLRVVSRLHHRLSALGLRHRVAIAVEAGVWDVHHVALLISMGADVVCPWLGCATAGSAENTYLKGLRSGFLEAMSMMGVTPSTAYCGARLVEAIGLDHEFMADEFPGVPVHLGGIGRDVLNREWFDLWASAWGEESTTLPDVGEFRHTKSGRRHGNNAEVVRSLQLASGYSKKIHLARPGSCEAFQDYSRLVDDRPPLSVLDLLRIKEGRPIPLEEVEPVEDILWRFMAPGMSEGALSEPAHRAVARAFNTLYRYCRVSSLFTKRPLPGGIGPIANSGEGGFDKARIGRNDGNRSVQYAGGRFTITPATAASADEAEVKFAQGAKPGKGGQLPGKKVSAQVAQRRGCEPGYELVSPPINHNLYSIEDVKLMLESWRHLNPSVNCALKYVATYGVEMVAVGGVNAGANRLHLSDGCGGTGAAKRVDQKHAGVPVACVLPTVQDLLIEEDARHLVELSVDGGVQNGTQALKLFLLGADRVGFGTSLLIAIGCSMLRKCHLSGVDPTDPNGKRKLGCTPGVATQDPEFIARFTGRSKHIARMLWYVAHDIRESLARMGVRSVGELVGRRDLLERRGDLTGKAAQLDLSSILRAPHAIRAKREYAAQSLRHMPELRHLEIAAAERALAGESAAIREALTNTDRCVGVGAAGVIARAVGDLGLTAGGVSFEHEGAAGHFYGAYAVDGMSFQLKGVAADSCFTAAYGGRLVVTPPEGKAGLALVGNAFGYGARGGRAYIAGRGGNRFGICFRKNHEGGGPVVVVECVEANAFQYMTGGTALVLGPTGHNLGAGMTGGRVFLLDADTSRLNSDYVSARPLDEEDSQVVRALLEEHAKATGSDLAIRLLWDFAPQRFTCVTTCLQTERVEPVADNDLRVARVH